MCSSCNKQEDLKLPIPYIDNYKLALIVEYKQKYDTGCLDDNWIFNTIQKIYESNYVYNPKQLARSKINMEQLRGLYQRGEFQEHIYISDDPIEKIRKIQREDISDIELMNQIKKQQQKDILSLKKK